MPNVVCLRPESDFSRVGVTPPPELDVSYLAPDDPSLADKLVDADAVVIPAVGRKLSPTLFAGSRVRLVQVTGAGVDRLDIPAMRTMGISIANVQGGSNGAIAEYVLSVATVLLRRLTVANAAIRRGGYAEIRNRLIQNGVNGLDGMVVGIIGMGVIGTAVARKMFEAGAHIVCHDPVSVDGEVLAEIGAEKLGLEELLGASDIVSLHVPLMPSTTDLIDSRRLGLMKENAILIQASRGLVVNESALAMALTTGRLAGAAVDVFSSEPPESDNPLLSLTGEAADRILLTPHIAGVSRQAWASLFVSAWNNVVRVLIANQEPESVL